MARLAAFTNLRYDPSHERCVLDVFRPADNENAPLVILIHGGGWIGGHPNQYHQSCIVLANHGLAAATVGYRLLDEAAWPDMAYDVLRGAAYLSAHASELGIDASRAVTLGSSAGGHLALALQAKARQWVAEGVVPEAPEIIGTVGQCPAAVLPEPDSNDRVKKLANGHPLEAFSPGHMAPELFRSVLIIHGDKDTVIPPARSRQFVERLRKTGADARLEMLPEAEHAFGYRLNHAKGREAMSLTLPYVKQLFR